MLRSHYHEGEGNKVDSNDYDCPCLLLIPCFMLAAFDLNFKVPKVCASTNHLLLDDGLPCHLRLSCPGIRCSHVVESSSPASPRLLGYLWHDCMERGST